MAQSRDDLLDTIKRLIALGSSPNEHEAQLATAKAAALMAEHNLSLVDVDAAAGTTTRDYCEEQISEYGAVPREVHLITHILEEFFFVECVLRKKRGVPTRVMLFGDRSNVEVARHAYVYLLRTFRGLANERRVPSGERPAYFIGVANGFTLAMREQRERDFAGARSHALVVVKSELAEACAAFYGKIKTTKLSPVYGSAEWAEAGEEDGRKIQLHKNLQGQSPRQLT